MRFLPALLLMIVPVAAQTPIPGDPHWVLVNAVDASIRPGFLQMQEEAQSLETNVEALCGAPSEATFETARNQFRSLVIAYSRIEFLRFGPLTESNRAERMFFWPDPRGRGLQQVQRIIADHDESATELASLQGKSVAVQGLGALEFVLFGTDSETLLSVAGGFRCRYGQAISEALVAISDELARAWYDGDGIARRISEPKPEYPDYRSQTESLEELVSAMAFGLEAIRDQRLLPFLGRDGEDPKPKSAPFWRSGMTVPSIVAGFEGILDLFEKSRIVEATPAESQWIGESVGFESGNLQRAAAAVTAPVEGALADPRQKQGMDYMVILSSSVQKMIGEDLAAALGLSTGFSSLDGD